VGFVFKAKKIRIKAGSLTPCRLNDYFFVFPWRNSIVYSTNALLDQNKMEKKIVYFHRTFRLRYLYIGGLILTGIVFSTLLCHKKTDTPDHGARQVLSSEKGAIVPSFCYWKTTMSFSKNEDTLWGKMGIAHMYVRLFDVDWNIIYNQPVPLGDLVFLNSWESILYPYKAVTPCVFITNEVLERSSLAGLDSLADKIGSRSVDQMSRFSHNFAYDSVTKIRDLDSRAPNANFDSLYGIRDSVQKDLENAWLARNNELLIDCDWTGGTKEKFFHLLRAIKRHRPGNTISATLRLWQYKNREPAGIPPVDRCLLMCYSVGNPREYGRENSIASFEAIQSYLDAPPYPIRLDIALPIYSWALVYRGRSFKGILKMEDMAALESDTGTFRKINETAFLFKRDTVIGTTYLRNGDELKIEKVSFEELTKIISIVKKQISYDRTTRVSFFSWDTTYIKSIGIDNVEKAFSLFN
jgi:hypothetical protein